MGVPFSPLPTLPRCLLFIFQACPTCPSWKNLPSITSTLPLSSSTLSLPPSLLHFALDFGFSFSNHNSSFVLFQLSPLCMCY
ncbi:hypothetical protein RIF29_18963 [Crotalaria pallida]|uniref:Uncharacterized protein n=1 Tax=Crotalaria pallida TaxID=3830 RepID=A0AAN9I7B1_CROPI